MNEIFGIDPEAPRDLSELRALLERFGPSTGRFIGRFPDDWMEMLRARFANLEGIDKSRFICLLQRHRDSILRTRSTYLRSKSWRKNAAASRELSKVLAANPNDERLPTIEDFLWDEKSFDSSRGAHIAMSVDAYCKAVRPLLEISSEVHISDRYFNLRKDSGELDRDRLAVLRGILKEARNGGRCESLVLHLQESRVAEVIESRRRLPGDLAMVFEESGVSVDCKFHARLRHGRYIVSIKGGLQFDHGFTLHRFELNHVHWLSSSELLPLHRLFGLSL